MKIGGNRDYASENGADKKGSSWASGLVVEGKESVGSKLMTGMTKVLANYFTQDIDDNNFSACPKTI